MAKIALQFVAIAATQGTVYGLDKDGKVWHYTPRLTVDTLWEPLPMEGNVADVTAAPLSPGSRIG